MSRPTIYFDTVFVVVRPKKKKKKKKKDVCLPFSDRPKILEN